MKKFMKSCAIAALVLLILGMVMASVAGSIKGRTTINDVVEAVTGGRVHVNLEPFENWGITASAVGEQMQDAMDNVSYEIGDSTSFDKNREILRGDIEKYSLGSDISGLCIEVGGCTFETEASPDDNFYIEAKRAGKFQAYVEDGKLYVIETTTSWSLNDKGNCKITFYIPADYRFDSVDLELGAGILKLDELNAAEASLAVGAGQIVLKQVSAEQLELSVGAGQIEVKNMAVGELDAEVGMGELTAEGAVGSSADIDCSMGNVEVKLDGSVKDFNYEIEGAMGNIDIGRESYSGFSQSRSIDNDAEKTIQVNSSMGNITLRFTD